MVIVGSLCLCASLGSFAVPVVTMRLTAGGLSRRGSKRLGASVIMVMIIMVVVMLSLSGSLSLSSKRRLGTLAVPYIN